MENSLHDVTIVGKMLDLLYDARFRIKEIKEIRNLNGDPYHEVGWHEYNPMLEGRRNAAEPLEASKQILFPAKDTCTFKVKNVLNMWRCLLSLSFLQ